MMNVMNYQDYDVIFNVFEAIEKENEVQAQACFDAKFSSVVLNEIVGRDEYLKMYSHLKEGMPDAKFHVFDLSTNGETFKAKIHITGTHTFSFPSLKKGWNAMKPTNKKVNKVVTSVEFILRNDKIMEIRNLVTHKGVAAGLLKELDLLPKNYLAKSFSAN